MMIEPRVQGAGGMLFHDDEVLRRLRGLADRHDVLLIFDEIFVGFGRTGDLFACDGAGVLPDILTLSKALTGGTLPLSAAIARKRVFEAFWRDQAEAALMHGPTYMANPLACAAANASLDIFEKGSWKVEVSRIADGLRLGLEPCRDARNVVDVRVQGAIGAVEFSEPVAAAELCSRFANDGCWIRPMGRVIYLTPPFVITDEDLAVLTASVRRHVLV